MFFTIALVVGVAAIAVARAHGDREGGAPLVVLALLLAGVVQVALRMERDHAASRPFGVDAQRDLLRHRAGRHPDRRLLAEQLGDAALQPFRELAAAIPVDVETVGRARGQGLQHGGGIAVGRGIAERVSLRLEPHLAPLAIARHRASIGCADRRDDRVWPVGVDTVSGSGARRRIC